MALTPGTRLGVYEVTTLIGEGGMGQVYRARDTTLGREVAIKVLPEVFDSDPERLARFEREAKTLASLNHPHIAAIYGFEKSAGLHALVMELVEGDDLSALITRGAVASDLALPIAAQIAQALEAAHDQGVIHRDLKPANVKVRPDGTVKVLDFGLAKALDPLSASSASASMSPTITSPAMTQAGMILGTAAYMAPEQARGRAVDKRADIWAFGTVLFEMLTGTRAFPGEDITDTLAAVVRAEPDWTLLPPSLSPALVVFLRRCLQKDPRQRVGDIRDMRLALEGAFDVTVRQPVAPTPARRSRLAWIVAAVAGLATAVLAVPTLRHLGETPLVQQRYQFQIAPPPNTRFTTFRLSPDGRYVAFIAGGGQTGAAGQGGLWIHELDSLESHQIPGSEGSTYPFWNPDSTMIGFFQGGVLKKVAAAGGPSQKICDVADSRGGAWGPDGTILFTDGPARPIFRVPSAGGTPAPVTKFTGGDPGEGHRAPEFLPDGQHFLFNATANKPDNAGIYLGSLDGSALVRLLPDPSNSIYVPDSRTTGERTDGGHLFFLRDGTLMALPFDLAKRKATAEAFPVAEGVAIAANNRYGAFSLGGRGTLAYWGSGGEANNRELVWTDRSGKRQKSIGQPQAFVTYALSPDEKSVAAMVGPSLQQDIWLLDSASGSSSRLTFGFTGGVPHWFADGMSIVYSRRNGVTVDLVRKPITGGAEEVLLANIVNARPTDVSFDGKLVVHDMSVPKTAFDIGLLSATGDHRESAYLSSPANERSGQLSPDGKWMAYQSDESGQYQVYVQTIPAGGKNQISVSGGTIPAWRHDGTELYYLGVDQQLMAVRVRINGASFSHDPPQALFTAIGASGFAVTRDGQRFLMNFPAGGETAAAGPPLTVVTSWQAALKK